MVSVGCKYEAYHVNDHDHMEELRQYHFNYENLAFEGGGVKMMGHIGIIKALEELDLMKTIKRFSGTSGGSMIATMAAIGLTAAEMEKACSIDFEKTFMDAFLGKVSFLRNLIVKYGWNPGNRFHDYIKRVLRENTGNEGITFMEVYETYGTELCIVATNVTTMSVEYFHPKTTPDVKVSLAVKCSCALPGYVQPPYVMFGDSPNFMTDGGFCCSFPLFVFDGWYLSMDFEDSFFHKLGKDELPFGTLNPKTLGCLLMSVGDGDLFQGKLLMRAEEGPNRPNTKLARTNGPRCEKAFNATMKKQEIVEAGLRLMKCMRKADENKDTKITYAEFQQAVKKMSEEDMELLFGANFNIENAFSLSDSDGNKEINDKDFFSFMQKKGLRFRALLEGGNMVEIKSLGAFFGALSGILVNTTRYISRKQHDVLRTIGVNTDYIQTSDFSLEPADKKFLIQQGRQACVDYLMVIVKKHNQGELPAEFESIVARKDDYASDYEH